MADRVIVVGVRRGNERVSASEIAQMLGRAGRKHSGPTCKADIVVERDDFDDVFGEISDSPDFRVCSALDSPEKLAFHLLPEICVGRVRNMKSAEMWYSKSLAAFQNRKAKMGDAIDVLKKAEVIRESPLGFMSTKLGDIAAKLYFHPMDIKDWRDNFGTIFEMGLECDDAAIAWAVGSTSVTRASGDFGQYWHVVGEFKDNLPPGLELREGTVITAVLWWSALTGRAVGKMKNHVISMRDDFGRIHNALTSIDREVAGWDMGDFFNELRRRISKGIPSFLADLCALPGITKSRADYLYNMGVRDIEGIRDMLDMIAGEVDEKFAATLKDIVNGVR